MKKQGTTFAVNTNSSVVNHVGKSTITQPKTCFKGGFVKWFDDSKLLKKPEN